VTITVTDSTGGPRVLTAEGELDVLTAEPLLAQASALVAGASAVVLDLSRVTFFDSAAVHFVDLLLRRGAEVSVPVRVVAPAGRPPHRVLGIVGMLSCADEDLETAVQAVARPR
jgi:anti-anti-sigma factor